jgi:hypothetical protein
MTTSINNAFNVKQVNEAMELGATQSRGISKDIIGQLIANTDEKLLVREHPELILINSKTALRDKFYIICMEKGIECIYCKTTYKDGSGNVETKERPFTVKRCLRILKQLEELHWVA